VTDKIGVLPLHAITDYNRTDNQVTLSGYYRTRDEYDQLHEIFRKAVGNTSIFSLIGGHESGYDVTSDSVLSQWCQFDHEKLFSGCYLLLSIDYSQRNLYNYWPFTVKMLFLGMTAILVDGFECAGMEELDGDWGI